MVRSTEIRVPPDHNTMVSFEALDITYGAMCVHGVLEIFRGGRRVARICSDLIPNPFTLRGSLLRVQFQMQMLNHVGIKGFRMLFSFHRKNSTLPRVSVGQWNCSVPQWVDYQQHFPCDLTSQCLDGRDEALCPYTTPLCGHGQFTAGRKCYTFMNTAGERISWNEAALDCRMRGSYLVSLNTAQEWDAVVNTVERYKRHSDVFIGITSAPDSLPPLYHEAFLQADGSMAYYMYMYKYPDRSRRPACLKLYANSQNQSSISMGTCDMPTKAYFICEDAVQERETLQLPQMVVKPTTAPSSLMEGLVLCPHGHWMHAFLACDPLSVCWGKSSYSCGAPMTPLPPDFVCTSGVTVPYTLVCDFRSDCDDNSDENFCQHLPCKFLEEFQCHNGQCVSRNATCNKIKDCLDGSDELMCTPPFILYRGTNVTTAAIVRFSGSAFYSLEARDTMQPNQTCPPSYFQCPSNGYCLPVYVRCNGVYDCPQREDEQGCDEYACPGFYRCRASGVCISLSERCDDIYHCPQRDDELLCDFRCPENCTCYGLAFFCHAQLEVAGFSSLRYLDASGSGMNVGDVENNTMLVGLSLARCQLTELGSLHLYNLHSLDLSDNLLTRVTNRHIRHLPNLRRLALAANPLTEIFLQDGASTASFPRLFSLDLSQVTVTRLSLATFRIFPSLQRLNLTGCGVDIVHNNDSQSLRYLKSLDIRGCPVTHFPASLFQGMDSLQSVFADNYKLCCPAMLPSGFNLASCRAPSNEISSCDNLLRSDIYRGFLALFAGLALLGNLLTFVARVFLSEVKNGFEILTVTLCLSDFLMGVYLAIIGVADRLYMGDYLWNDVSWRGGATCQMAGFLFMVSNEVSAIIVCLITLDRFLVLRFPFSQVRFTRQTAIVASVAALMVGICLATVPLLPALSHWHFYDLNSVCVPLPITRQDFPGHNYAFSVLIVFNFVLFLLIAVGQAVIYWSVQRNSMRSSTNDGKTASSDFTLARRLVTVAVTDFLCWFPVGLLGILASSGLSISSEVNVVMVVLIVPLNSAINPFLYTLNRLLEKRRAEKEERLKKFLLAKLQNEHPNRRENKRI